MCFPPPVWVSPCARPPHETCWTSVPRKCVRCAHHGRAAYASCKVPPALIRRSGWNRGRRTGRKRFLRIATLKNENPLQTPSTPAAGGGVMLQ
eukprot:10100-Prorocentrum_minimum.AAC.2